MVQPGTRPDAVAFGPETRSVQSPLLSSRQWPSAPRRTTRPTAGGVAPAASGGSNPAPAFGGGLRPPYGPRASLTTFGSAALFIARPPASSVVALPEKNIAA